MLAGWLATLRDRALCDEACMLFFINWGSIARRSSAHSASTGLFPGFALTSSCTLAVPASRPTCLPPTRLLSLTRPHRPPAAGAWACAAVRMVAENTLARDEGDRFVDEVRARSPSSVLQL